MNRMVWAVPTAFALGFAIAWSGKSTDRAVVPAPSGKSADANRVTARDPSAASRRTTPALERVKGYFRKIDDNAGDRGVQEDCFKDIPTGDIPLVVEQWRKRAGFSGLSYEEQYQIKKLVKSWYEKEPAIALDWVAGMECRKDRQELVSEIVGVEAKRDLNHAIELAKQYGKAELGGLDMPDTIRDTLGACDAARFMDIMAAFPSDGSGSSGSEMDFKEGFDFAGVAALLIKGSSEDHRMPYSYYPTNFLSEWTKIDPDAAWNWVSEKDGRRIMFNSAGDFFETLAQSRSKEQINAFVIEHMASRENDDAKFQLAWTALSAKPDAGQIADFIERLPGDRSANLERLTKASNSGTGGKYDEFRNLLLARMTAEERMTILPNVFAESSRDDSSWKKTARVLRDLGHTDEEIQMMFPNRKAK